MVWSMDRSKLSILFVLDCCHSVASVNRDIDRPIEVVYATNATAVTGSPGLGGEPSFSQKFVGALNHMRMRRPDKEYIDPIEITADLKERGVAGEAGHAILRVSQRMSMYLSVSDKPVQGMRSPRLRKYC